MKSHALTQNVKLHVILSFTLLTLKQLIMTTTKDRVPYNKNKVPGKCSYVVFN